MSHDPYEELAREAILDPEDDDKPELSPDRRRSRHAKRLQLLPGPYARVPLQWLLKPHRGQWFRPRERLLVYLLYRSHWGQRGVRMTDVVAAELGMSDRQKRRCVRELEELGAVRVEQGGRSHVMVVTPLVHTG